MTAPNPAPLVDERTTPCIGVCTMLPSGHCAGCRRTLAEIARWTELTLAERSALMRELETRTLPELESP